MRLVFYNNLVAVLLLLMISDPVVTYIENHPLILAWVWLLGYIVCRVKHPIEIRRQ